MAWMDWQGSSHKGWETQARLGHYQSVVFPVQTGHSTYKPVHFPEAHPLPRLFRTEDTREVHLFYARLLFHRLKMAAFPAPGHLETRQAHCSALDHNRKVSTLSILGPLLV